LKTIYSYSLLTGVILGLVFTGLLFFSWNQGIGTMVSFHKYYALLPLVFLSVAGAAFLIQKKENWAIDWKLIIRFAFLSYIIFEIFYALANYLLFDIVDPSAYLRMVDQLNREDVQRLKEANAPEEKIRELIKMGEYAKQPITWVQRLVGIGQNLILDFIKSVLIGFLIKQVKR
jgi:Na+/H+-dicarboxylate symporter